MEGNLKVTPQDLINTADGFASKSTQVQNITNDMIQLINSLKSIWEGDAFTAYSTQFQKLDEDMQQMYRMIREHVTDLNEMATEYMRAENANVQLSQSLGSNVIS